MQIEPFAIERFYERWEFRAELMLSSSDCESLLGRTTCSRSSPTRSERLHALRLGYTEVPGLARAAQRRRRAATSASSPRTC